MKRALISLGAAFFGGFLAWLFIVVFLPSMYVEKSFNVVILSFVGSGIVAALVLWARARKRRV